MKKIYTKPEILFENFCVSTSIAAGCETKTNTPSSTEQCGMDFSGLSIFLSGMSGCADIGVDNVGGDGEYNGICYHVPQNLNNLFNS